MGRKTWSEMENLAKFQGQLGGQALACGETLAYRRNVENTVEMKIKRVPDSPKVRELFS